MKEKIQSYLVFTSGLYRFAMFAAAPLLLILLQVLLGGLELIVKQWMIMMLLMSVEVIFDFWSFGGIAVKNGQQLEYFKCSKKGLRLVESALKVNMIRVLVEGIVISLTGIGIHMLQRGLDNFWGEEVVVCVTMLAIEYFYVVVLHMITRFFEGVMANMAAASIGSIVMAAFLKLIFVMPYLILILFAALSVAVSVLNVWVIRKRVEVSYRDRED